MRYLCDMTNVRKHLKGMCILYKQMWGPEAFEVHQCDVFPRADLVAIVTACEHKQLKWSDSEHVVWSAIIPYLCSTGERKNAWTSGCEGDDNLMRSAFTLLDERGDELLMTQENILNSYNGCILQGKCPPGKTDRLGLIWSKQKQYFKIENERRAQFCESLDRVRNSLSVPG